jgi:hypothetical protein
MNKNKQIKPKKRETTRSRQKAFMVAFFKHGFNVSAACRDVGIDRGTFYLWRKNERFQTELHEATEARLDSIEAALSARIKAGDTTAIIFACKTLCRQRGYIEAEKVRAPESPDKKALEILDCLISGDIDVTAAGLQFSRAGIPLPEALRVLLAKVQAETPPPDLPASIPDEELEARYQAQLDKNEKQVTEFVPARQEEVRQLKEELKGVESYGPDAENRTAREGSKCQK